MLLYTMCDMLSYCGLHRLLLACSDCQTWCNAICASKKKMRLTFVISRRSHCCRSASGEYSIVAERVREASQIAENAVKLFKQ